jgi:hypothetical protein
MAEPLYTDADVELVARAVHGYACSGGGCSWSEEGLPCDLDEFAGFARAVLEALIAAGWRPPHQPRDTFVGFWDDLVAPDGHLDADLVRAELNDYWMVMGEVAKVYAELTDGRISKPNTLAVHVIGEANEAAERAIHPAVREEVAEEIAQAIELAANQSYRTRGAAYRHAATIAREIGGRP